MFAVAVSEAPAVLSQVKQVMLSSTVPLLRSV
jgi:hypothetical protein